VAPPQSQPEEKYGSAHAPNARPRTYTEDDTRQANFPACTAALSNNKQTGFLAAGRCPYRSSYHLDWLSLTGRTCSYSTVLFSRIGYRSIYHRAAPCQDFWVGHNYIGLRLCRTQFSQWAVINTKEIPASKNSWRLCSPLHSFINQLYHYH